MIAAAWTLLQMLISHAVVDYHQGQISADKRSPFIVTRWTALSIHGFMHGIPVWIITGSWHLGLGEMVAHALIDRSKGRGWISTWSDQILHIGCKVVWLMLSLGQGGLA